jgi:hypothetical protein
MQATAALTSSSTIGSQGGEAVTMAVAVASRKDMVAVRK